jgi:transglutaminase-like putative cysteine protease
MARSLWTSRIAWRTFVRDRERSAPPARSAVIQGKDIAVPFLTLVFQASVYLTLGLSALILAHAEGSVFPAGMTIPIACAAWFFTERRKLLQLPTSWANVLGMGGFIAAMSELMTNNIEARLLSGAHLLVYLSWVVVFQKKEARQYLWMSALATLQVAVGAVLTTSETYGALLTVFFCGAIWTLSLFTLWNAYDRVLPRKESDLSEGASVDRDMDAAFAVETPDALSDRQPTQPVSYQLLQSSSSSTPGVQHEGQARVSLARFFFGTLVTSFACLIVAAAFFCLIPRVWVGAPTFGAESSPPLGYNVTGFTSEVTLGDIGRILESSEPVLSIRLTEHPSGEPLSMDEYVRRKDMDEPLFRGGVLTEYDRGSWRAPAGAPSDLLRHDGPENESRIRQEITLMPIRSNVLIALGPVTELNLKTRDKAGKSAITGAIPHPHSSNRVSFNYVAYTKPPTRSSSTGERPISEMRPRLQSMVKRQFTALPESIERLAAEARRRGGIVTDGDRPPDKVLVDRFVHWLRDSGEFQYSLDASIKNPRIDPVEDFLFERKRGHCEYYATALALLLRAVDIPTRLVSGFKGGTLNSITGSFDVEQRHAHAWVEAYVDGEWIALDATPAAPRNESVESLNPGIPTIRDLLSVIRDIWNTHILNMNIGAQRDRIYSPVQDVASAVWKSMQGDEQERASLWQSLKRFLTSPEEWISIKGGLVTFVLLSIGAGGYFGARRLLRWARNLTIQLREQDAANLFAVEFYERFRALCARAGMEREQSQTQREFGAEVETEWRKPLEADQATGVPAELTEMFYRVRFGNLPLSAEEMAAMETRLETLERAVSAAENANGHAGRPGTNGHATP